MSSCPKCEPDNPAARYADTCLRHRVEENLPAHYIDCDRFQTYNYGTRSGTCDCTATADFEALLASSVCTPADPAQSPENADGPPLCVHGCDGGCGFSAGDPCTNACHDGAPESADRPVDSDAP